MMIRLMAGAIVATALLVGLLSRSSAQVVGSPPAGPRIHPIERATQVKPGSVQLLLREALDFVKVSDARAKFNVTGGRMTVAVLDTGLNQAHVDFWGAVKAVRNFSTDDNGAADLVADCDGHGTNVTGIILANGFHRVDPAQSEDVNRSLNPPGMHTGVAPDASVAVLKVLPSGSWQKIEDALEWVLAEYRTHGITAVNMSIQNGKNFQDDKDAHFDRMRSLIDKLQNLRIPVVVSAGNSFADAKSEQGMSYPAILRQTISVGAVYDAVITDPLKLTYVDFLGAVANASRVKPGQITPFSQRLAGAGELATDVVAPGAVIISSGRDGLFGESVQQGTSQAAPIVTGIILLMQEWYRDAYIAAIATKEPARAAALRKSAIDDIESRPSVDQLRAWLRAGPSVTDDYGDDDNVINTDATFKLVDAMAAFTAMTQSVTHR